MPDQALPLPAQTNVLCFGQSTGAINITVAGGTAPYTFVWSNGATTEDISNVAAGTYTITVTDANGCTATRTSTITQPTQLNATETHTAIACFGGNSTVTISGSGGTIPYTGTGTFLRPVGTYSFIVTDANGCTATTQLTIAAPECLKVYPIPTRNILYVSHSSGRNATIKIYDVFARLVFEKKVQQNSILTTLDLSRLPGGIYTLFYYHQGLTRKVNILLQ